LTIKILKSYLDREEKMGVCKFNNQVQKNAACEIKKNLHYEINWEELLFDLRHLEIRILELIYLPEPRTFALGKFIQKIKKLNYSEKTIRRKLKNLENLGLIQVIRSTIMIINPVLDLAKNIKTLTIMWNHRDRNL